MSSLSIPGTAGRWAIAAQSCIHDDGGQHWSPQASGVVCTLQLGLLHRRPYRLGGRRNGLALSARHVGRRPRHARRRPEPGSANRCSCRSLNKIRFVSDRQGWAIGCSSAMYPGGVFVTRDGGRSWQRRLRRVRRRDRPDDGRSLRRPQCDPWRPARATCHDQRGRLWERKARLQHGPTGSPCDADRSAELWLAGRRRRLDRLDRRPRRLVATAAGQTARMRRALRLHGAGRPRRQDAGSPDRPAPAFSARPTPAGRGTPRQRASPCLCGR